MSTVTIYNSSINFSLSATGIPKSPRNRYLYHLDDDVNYSKCAFTFPAHGSAQPKLKPRPHGSVFGFAGQIASFARSRASNHPVHQRPHKAGTMGPHHAYHGPCSILEGRSIFHFCTSKPPPPLIFAVPNSYACSHDASLIPKTLSAVGFVPCNIKSGVQHFRFCASKHLPPGYPALPTAK